VLGIVTVAVDACALLVFSPVTAAACATAAPFLHEADSAIEDLIETTRNPINQILKALHGVEVALSDVIPAAAVAGGIEVGMKYKPPITGVPVAIPPSVKLPLTNGTTDRLCGEAAIAVGQMVAELVNLFVPGIGSIAGWISGPLASLAESSPGYFCELGGAGGPPDVSGLINDNANSKCDSDLKLKQHNLDEANRLWRAECSKFGVTCIDSVFDEFGNKMQSTMPDIDDVRLPPKQTPIPAPDKAHLRQLQHDRDVAEQDLDSFSKRQCVDNTKKDLQKKLSQIPPPKQGNGQDMEPMKVDPKWQNGDTLGQVLGLVRSDGTILNWGPKGVKVGAWNDRRTRAPIRPPAEAYWAYAQAEFFYDCAGAWKDNQCNGGKSPLHDDQEAMWHFRWRARSDCGRHGHQGRGRQLAPWRGRESSKLGVEERAPGRARFIQTALTIGGKRDAIETYARDAGSCHGGSGHHHCVFRHVHAGHHLLSRALPEEDSFRASRADGHARLLHEGVPGRRRRR
jgi:hypothetical protein